MELKFDAAEKLLDIERFSRIYMLKNVKKLDWGYDAELSLAKFLTFKCFVYVKDKEVNIVEKGGKFTIKVGIGEEIKIDVKSSNPLLRETLKRRLENNFEKYKDVIQRVEGKKSKRIVFMKSIGDYVLDLRGQVCPVPEIETKKKMMELKVGESLEVLVDNPAAVEVTLPEVARLFNCRYEVFNMGDYVSFVFYKLSATPTKTAYMEVIERRDEEKIKELMKEGEFRAFLYAYFDKIVKRISSYGVKKEHLVHDDFGVISAAPIGRGWLLTAVVDKDRVLAVRLDTDSGVYFNEDALDKLPNEGEVNIFYLSHDGR